MNRHLLEELAYLAAGTALALAIILGAESGRVALHVAFGVVAAAPLAIFAHVAAHAAGTVVFTGKHVFVQMGPDPALLRFGIGRVDFRVSGTHPASCDFGTLDAPPRKLAPVYLAGSLGSLAFAAVLAGLAIGIGDPGSLAFDALCGGAALSLAIGASGLLPVRVPRWWPGAEGRGETDLGATRRMLAAHREGVRSGIRPRRVGPEFIPGAGHDALVRAEERLQAGLRDGARRALEQAAASPEPAASAAAQFDLGLLAREDGNDSEAARRYQAALEAGVPGPSSAAAINLARLLERGGRYEAACHALERAIAMGDPRWRPFAQANLGDVKARAGDCQAAVDAYGAALSGPPHEHTARAAYRLGKILIARGEDRPGRAALAMAAEADGEFAERARAELREAVASH